MSALKIELSKHNWQDELADSSPSKNIENIHATLTSAINHCIPYKKHTIRQKHICREP